jgi:hypothetical protein
MSGDISYQNPSLRFRPGFGWIYLNEQNLLQEYSEGAASYVPFFEGDNFYLFSSSFLVSSK